VKHAPYLKPLIIVYVNVNIEIYKESMPNHDPPNSFKKRNNASLEPISNSFDEVEEEAPPIS
jgi:hypothetical protein